MTTPSSRWLPMPMEQAGNQPLKPLGGLIPNQRSRRFHFTGPVNEAPSRGHRRTAVILPSKKWQEDPKESLFLMDTRRYLWEITFCGRLLGPFLKTLATNILKRIFEFVQNLWMINVLWRLQELLLTFLCKTSQSVDLVLPLIMEGYWFESYTWPFIAMFIFFGLIFIIGNVLELRKKCKPKLVINCNTS